MTFHKLIDSLLINIEAESLKFLAELDGEREANITETDNADDSFLVLNFLNYGHSNNIKVQIISIHCRQIHTFIIELRQFERSNSLIYKTRSSHISEDFSA